MIVFLFDSLSTLEYLSEVDEPTQDLLEDEGLKPPKLIIRLFGPQGVSAGSIAFGNVAVEKRKRVLAMVAEKRYYYVHSELLGGVARSLAEIGTRLR